MSAPTSDRENSDLSMYLAKRLREEPDLLTNSEFDSAIDDLGAEPQRRVAAGPEPAPPPRRWKKALALIGRIAVVVTFTALVALLTIFAKPLWQSARALLNADSQTLQASKTSDRLTANNAPPNSPLDPCLLYTSDADDAA